MLFQRRGHSPSTPKYFLLSFNGTPHPLSSTIAELQSAVIPTSCELQHEFQFLCYDSYVVIIYTCLQRHFRLSLRETTQARKRVQCRIPETAVQYSENVYSVRTGYVFFETLVLNFLLF